MASIVPPSMCKLLQRANAFEQFRPCLQVRVHGVKEDCRSFEAEVQPSNGFDPAIDCSVEVLVTRPDVAVLTFEIFDGAARSATDSFMDKAGSDAGKGSAVRLASMKKAAVVASGLGVGQGAGPIAIASAAFPCCGLRAGLRWAPLWDRRFRPIQHGGLILKVTTLADGSQSKAASGDRRSLFRSYLSRSSLDLKDWAGDLPESGVPEALAERLRVAETCC